MKDFKLAFSKDRNVGGTSATNGNPNAAEMNSDLSKWNVAEVTTMEKTFHGASKMNFDLSKWNVAEVTTMEKTFQGASKMNVDLSTWNVAKVTTLAHTFASASNFAGTGLSSWNTASVTNLYGTFMSASKMNSDLSKWNVGQVTTLQNTFRGAAKFAGTGLGLWDTAKVTSLHTTFRYAGTMNSDLSQWNVAKVKELEYTFDSAYKFAGTGLSSWDIAKVNKMNYVFGWGPSTSSDRAPLTSCNKRRIADAWTAASDPGGTKFIATSYGTDWAGETCAGATVTFNDAQFKQASWGTYHTPPILFAPTTGSMIPRPPPTCGPLSFHLPLF